MIYRRRGIEAIAAEGDVLSPVARIHHAQSLQPASVALPDLPIGSNFLERWRIREEPAPITWSAHSYDCVTPALFIIRDGQVHTSSGVITIGSDVVEESLVRFEPHRHGMPCSPDALALGNRTLTHMPGTHISLLGATLANYFHAVMDGIARIATIPPHILASATSVLFSAGSVVQQELLSLFRLPPHLERHPVHDNDSLNVETLILPMSIYGVSSYHPIAGAFFDRLSSNVDDIPGQIFPKRIYLDRSGAASRKLMNEADVIASLAPFGYVPIKMETLSIPDQIRLFRNADSIVAPHGAGLTNIGFCRPHCHILELQMDAYVHWGFRNLAALRGLAYDCVLGRSLDPWPESLAGVHGLRWHVSTQHVAAAVKEAVLF